MARLAAHCLSARVTDKYPIGTIRHRGDASAGQEARGPRLDPEDRAPVTKGDVEDVFSRLAAAPPNAQGLKRVADFAT